MNSSANVEAFETVSTQPDAAQLDAAAAKLIADVGIPPRPSILEDLQAEIASDDASISKIVKLVGMDAGLSAAVLKGANSPLYGLRRRAESLSDAVSFLGMNRVGGLVTSILLSKALSFEGLSLQRFWDVSTKRSYALQALAPKVDGVSAANAHTFGLFCDVGIPLLMRRFAAYSNTLHLANTLPDVSFTAVERQAHGADHATLGALMGRSWGVSQTTCLAIRTHHDYGALAPGAMPSEVQGLVALGLVCEVIIQRYAGLNATQEWAKGGGAALELLGIDDAVLEDWCDQVHEGFSQGVA